MIELAKIIIPHCILTTRLNDYPTIDRNSCMLVTYAPEYSFSHLLSRLVTGL